MTVFSITETETEQVAAASPSDLLHKPALVENIALDQKRNLASVDRKNEMIQISILCPESAKVQKLATQQMVMFNLSLCKEAMSAESVSMTNVTNGFKAQIFKLSAKNYRTDFIQLSRGNNILLIESVLKDGQKRVQTLEILSGS